MLGFGAGALTQKPLRYIEKAITTASKEQLINSISNGADDIARSTLSNRDLLTELYDDVYKPYNSKPTKIKAEDVISGMDDATKKDVIPILRRVQKLDNATEGIILDANGKVYHRPMNVREVNNLMQDLQEEINLRTYSATPKDATSIIKARKFLKENLRKSLPPEAQSELTSLDTQYGKIKPKTDKILKDIGWSHKDQTVNTTKLDKLLSTDGDITSKAILNELLELDENMRPAIRDYTRRRTRYQKYIEPREKKPGILQKTANTVIRNTVPNIIKILEGKGYTAQRDGDFAMMHEAWQAADHWKRVDE
jgi:hypothetical protein